MRHKASDNRVGEVPPGGGTPEDGAVAFGGANGETSRADIGVADFRSFGNAEKEDNGDEDDAVQWGKGMREVEILGKQRINGKPAATGRGREAGKCADCNPMRAGDDEVGKKAVGFKRESRQNTLAKGGWINARGSLELHGWGFRGDLYRTIAESGPTMWRNVRVWLAQG